MTRRRLLALALAPLLLVPALPAEAAAPTSLPDARGDVSPATLDIQRVTVTNTAKRVVVTVTFPGVAQTYDFPTGNISVFLDTDATRAGAEWGHFMEFWSDYRFTPVRGWKEQSAVDGCEAQLRSDPDSKLRWFRFTVRKRPGCLTGDAVRVAVSTMNTGDLEPYVEYDHPAVDWLEGRRQWSEWVAAPTPR